MKIRSSPTRPHGPHPDRSLARNATLLGNRFSKPPFRPRTSPPTSQLYSRPSPTAAAATHSSNRESATPSPTATAAATAATAPNAMADTAEHRPAEEEEEEAAAAGEDEDTGAQVAPIVKLEEVAVTTGEEDEEVLLDM